MTHDLIDFGKLYRAALAERDPQRKQILLSQVQRAISKTEPEEQASRPKFAPESAALPKLNAVA
jgi:hypothetical protein